VPDDLTEVPKTKKSKRGLFIAIGLSLIVLLFIGLWLGASSGNGTSPEAGDTKPIKATLHLETFVLNLADTEQRSYLRAGIDLGLKRAIQRDEQMPIARTRDTILGVLSQATASELMTADGKTKLKETLIQALQQRVPELEVEEVYFTEFLIQR
jgi:flagellar basal body-associated protein FliL